MQRWVRIFLALAVVAVAVPWRSQPAVACSCVAGLTPDNLEFSDVVFAGTVLAGERPEPKDSPFDPISRDAFHIVTLAADHVWLGDVGSRVEIVSAKHGATCGYEFVDGQRYLVYAASRGSSSLEASLCSPTRPYDDQAVLALEAVAGPGRPVESSATARNESDSNSGLQDDWPKLAFLVAARSEERRVGQ